MARTLYIVYKVERGYDPELPVLLKAFSDEQAANEYRQQLLDEDSGYSLSYEELRLDRRENKHPPEWIEFWNNFVDGKPTTPAPKTESFTVEWDRYFDSTDTLHIDSVEFSDSKDPRAKDLTDYPPKEDEQPATEQECQELNKWAWNNCFVVTRYGDVPKGQLCGMDEEHCQNPAVCYLKRNDPYCPGAVEGFWWCGRCADGGG